MFGTLAGVLAGWFTGSSHDSESAEVSRLTDEITSLRRAVEKLQVRIPPPDGRRAAYVTYCPATIGSAVDQQPPSRRTWR
jgi:hypothetical protein